MKVVVNKCYGGFSISDAAYLKLIEWGTPVRKYKEQERDPETNRFKDEPLNDGEIIFDRDLTPKGENEFHDKIYWEYREDGGALFGRYWDTWLDYQRSHPMLIRVVEELGEAANGRCAKLEVIEIPDGVDYVIEEYDGLEHIAEKHRTW